MDDFSSISIHAKKYGLVPDKKLGQNFIFDSSLCDKIVKITPNLAGTTVLEIGSGPGGLTRSIIAANPKKIIVIEKDKRAIPILADLKTAFTPLEIINDDALNLKLSNISDSPLVIISNLPYNVGTEILMRLSGEIALVESMTLMLQKEVVERIVARPDTKEYGRLSVICQLLYDVRKEFDVSPKAFYPPPKVTSSIVSLKPKKERIDPDLVKIVEKITHAAFGMRRKMIKSSLKSIFSENLETILLECKIDSILRAENLSVKDYMELAVKFQKYFGPRNE